MSKDVFKDKLQYGDEEWEYFAANGTEPCPFGCIMKRRLKPPFDYSLVGDCRVPYSPDCCMNKQDKMKREAEEIIAELKQRMKEKKNGHS